MNFNYFVNLALWLLEKPFLVWIKYSALYLPNITAGLADTQIKDKKVGLYKNSRCDTIKKSLSLNGVDMKELLLLFLIVLLWCFF